jgi:ketosteroid isomerase-like protein
MILALLFGACGGSGGSPSGSLAALRSTAEAKAGCEGESGACAQAALLAADDALQIDVKARGIAAGFTAALDDDATYITTLQPLLRGKPAIVAYLQAAFPDAASSSLSWIVARGDVSSRGDLGYTFGWTTFTGPNGKAVPGHYMAVWRRAHEPDGRSWVLASYLRYRSLPRTPPPSWFGPVPPSEDKGVRVNVEKELAVLEAVDSDFAALSVAQGQSVAHAQFAAPDAVEMLTDVVYGRDAIVASHAHDRSVLNWWPSGGDVARSGDIGYTLGRYVFTDLSVNPSVDYPGHYLTIWKRQPDGQWKYVLGSGTYSPFP